MILATLGNIFVDVWFLFAVILLRTTSPKNNPLLFWRHNSGGFFHFLRLHCLQVTLTPPGLASSLPLATTCMAKKEAPKDPRKKWWSALAIMSNLKKTCFCLGDLSGDEKLPSYWGDCNLNHHKDPIYYCKQSWLNSIRDLFRGDETMSPFRSDRWPPWG